MADGLLLESQLNLRTSERLISLCLYTPLLPLCLSSSLRLLPSGGGSSPGWGPALGVWGRVCLSEWGTVLPLQGPLGAPPGDKHLGEHQVSAHTGA